MSSNNACFGFHRVGLVCLGASEGFVLTPVSFGRPSVDRPGSNIHITIDTLHISRSEETGVNEPEPPIRHTPASLKKRTPS
jgi:hypothetical protein